VASVVRQHIRDRGHLLKPNREAQEVIAVLITEVMEGEWDNAIKPRDKVATTEPKKKKKAA
jgi:hypothetical protein